MAGMGFKQFLNIILNVYIFVIVWEYMINSCGDGLRKLLHKL